MVVVGEFWAAPTDDRGARMSELRQDVTTGEWVVFATERAKRPHDFTPSSFARKGPPPQEQCPFCPGREEMTPPEVARLPGRSQKEAWSVRVVPNRFAALSPEGKPHHGLRDGHFPWMSGSGAHEVVIETPVHDISPAQMSEEDMIAVFMVYRGRYRALQKLPGVKAIVIFKNHGERAGTSLAHPHSQIIASPVEPPLVRRKLEVARQYFVDSKSSLYRDLVRWEVERGDRVLFRSEGFTAFHPHASRWPFETWICSSEGAPPCFGRASDQAIAQAALSTRRAIKMLYAGLGEVPFNYVIFTLPIEEESAPWFSWHIQIVPRLTTPAGFELGSGMYINTALPEQTAAFLRDAAGV